MEEREGQWWGETPTTCNCWGWHRHAQCPCPLPLGGTQSAG